eukprot:scaffold2671_cov252-Pinguiococcus_pyrenoidosus.AAC.7
MALVILCYLATHYYAETYPEYGRSPRPRNAAWRKVASREAEEDGTGGEPEVEGEEEEEDDDEGDEDDDGLVGHVMDGGKTPIRQVPSMVFWSNLAAENASDGRETDGEKANLRILQELAVCAGGLNFFFVIWGLLQERILTRPYEDGEYFTHSYTLVFVSRIVGLAVSVVLMYITKTPWSWSTSVDQLYEFSYSSVTNMLSSWCQYEALKYVSFPTASLSKAFKLVPVMTMGYILLDRQYPGYDFGVATFIGIGVAIFISSAEDFNWQENSFGDIESDKGTLCGIMLLLLYLFFDSFTGQWQARLFRVHPDMTSLQMMLTINGFSTVLSAATLVHTGELTPAFDFIARHPECHVHLIAFALCAIIGQMFIFRTIKLFGPVVFTIIMTVRLALSIMASCWLYDHSIASTGFLGLTIVFASVGYRINRKIEGKTLIKWHSTEQNRDDAAMIHEFHEHIDM